MDNLNINLSYTKIITEFKFISKNEIKIILVGQSNFQPRTEELLY